MDRVHSVVIRVTSVTHTRLVCCCVYLCLVVCSGSLFLLFLVSSSRYCVLAFSCLLHNVPLYFFVRLSVCLSIHSIYVFIDL